MGELQSVDESFELAGRTEAEQAAGTVLSVNHIAGERERFAGSLVHVHLDAARAVEPQQSAMENDMIIRRYAHLYM